MEGLFGDLKCFDPTQTAKDCAQSCINPLSWFKKNPLRRAQNNKQKRKRIESLEENIREHRDKIAKEPNANPKNHWEKEIRDWLAEIERIRKRLPGKK